ncbi:hypothetical protein LOK49_LG03G03344 [Camellia lanceoleosa]|uniref:Uncharacterized protein n=1 Tax=Camellia lanceoleosa TaxID=1840588 RepID=A0ACC0ICS3_9ERIC|nr:hypothetical protein LOK49_LG03G03344 [Camellia lanceoleosa]
MQYNNTWDNQFVVIEHWRPLLVYDMYGNIVEDMGSFKLESIGNIDVEMGSPTVTLSKKSSASAVIGWIVPFVAVYNLNLCALTRQLAASGPVRDSWQFEAW